MTLPPDVPDTQLFRLLLQQSVVTAAEAATLVSQLGVVTLADLTAALDEGRIARLAGATMADRLQQAADALDLDTRPLTLGRSWDLLDSLLDNLSATCPSLDGVTPAGDVRRVEPLVTSIVVVARTPDPPAAVDALCALTTADHVRHRTGRRVLLAVQQTEVDFRIAAPDEYGSMLFTATGSRAHVNAVYRRRGQRLAAREEDVYAQAGLPFIAPELRQGSGEIEAAAAGTLPRLVSREDIRGDLHMHSTYSDGRDTLESMVKECAGLGYSYIAITDHSETAAASRTVTVEQLARQRDEIARLRERYSSMTILHGLEVEILPDGRLDFEDAVLAGLDIVLASLHDGAGQDARTLTRRCIQAMRHPLVNVITHPANRLVGRHEGYALDFDAVFEAAVETGTALEIDGAPAHLDMDGAHARRAVAAGVVVTIDSDCHRARLLDRQMRIGVGTARRGWVEPRHVLNARPLDEVRAFVSAKRSSRPG